MKVSFQLTFYFSVLKSQDDSVLFQCFSDVFESEADLSLSWHFFQSKGRLKPCEEFNFMMFQYRGNTKYIRAFQVYHVANLKIHLCFVFMSTSRPPNTYVFKMCFVCVYLCVSLFFLKLHNTYASCRFATKYR